MAVITFLIWNSDKETYVNKKMQKYNATKLGVKISWDFLTEWQVPPYILHFIQETKNVDCMFYLRNV